MTGSVGIFSAECRAESVYGTKCGGTQLAFQLARHGECCRLAEEVLRVVHLAVISAWGIIHVKRGHLEHRSGSLAVAGSDKRSVEIEKALFLEKLMYRERKSAAYAEHRPERVGARTQMRFLAEELQGVAFLLQRVFLRVGSAEHGDALGLDFGRLPFAHRLYEHTCHVEARTRSDKLQHLLVGKFCQIEDYLDILDGRTVIEGDELHILVAATCTHPPLYIDFTPDKLGREDIFDFSTFHSCLNLQDSDYSNDPILR